MVIIRSQQKVADVLDDYNIPEDISRRVARNAIPIIT